MLAEPDEALTHVYFPDTAVVSVVARMADGAEVEVGTIGNEGMVGIPVLLGAEASVDRTFAQSRGIRVLDRRGLEAATCECYGVVRRQFDRLLS